MAQWKDHEPHEAFCLDCATLTFVWRGLGVLVGCIPIAILVASLLGDGGSSTAGLVVMLIALAIAALNSSLALRREERNVSGVPLIGTILVVVGGIVGFGSLACAVLGLVAYALDTGGIPWFVFATWRDDSLWSSTESDT